MTEDAIIPFVLEAAAVLWLRSFTPITSFVYAHGDLFTYYLPATPSRLSIGRR